MNISFPKLHTADLDWQTIDDIDIPISKQFGDVYFSKANGLLETRHVFLNGNDLHERLNQLEQHQCFIIGETGFGTGLNFLALWQLWQQVRPNNNSHLHFISVEKFPLSREDIIRALSVWDELKHLSEKLITQYPLPLAGCHRLFFPDERISIDLWLGDAAHSFPLIQSQQPVNAWFLDGFAPSCNPELWQEHIFQHIMRLSGKGTTFASFSVAGVLKRALKSYGVDISRPKGFGHKREMLKAIWSHPPQISLNYSQLPVKSTRRIAIIGAGIAGLNCAWAFAQRGIDVDIYEKDAPLAGGSGNPLAMLNPKLCPISQVATHLMATSWQYALRFYSQFSGFKPLEIYQFHDKNRLEAEQLCSDYPDDILSWHNSSENVPAASYLKKAAALSPHQFAEQVLAHPNIHLHHVEITSIQHDINSVSLYTNDSEYRANNLVVCNAIALNQLLPEAIKLKPIRGQVSWAKIATPFSEEQQYTGYSYGGYAAPIDHNHLIFGASFYPNREDTKIEMQDHQHNLTLIQNALPQLATQLPDINTWHGRASLRAQTPDYLPLAGRINEKLSNIHILAGLGSKGFLFAPLCSEMIVSQILNMPLPVPSSLAHLLRPNRFKIKALR